MQIFKQSAFKHAVISLLSDSTKNIFRDVSSRHEDTSVVLFFLLQNKHDSLKIAGAGNKEQLQNYLLIWNGTLSKFVERKRDCLCSTRPPTA